MLETVELTKNQWKVAHGMAIALVKDETDVNEFGKTIAYLREFCDRTDAGDRFFKYLHTLAKQGQQIGHSKKTVGYYEAIFETCDRYLRAYQSDPAAMLQILGWTFRLMKYYKVAEPIGETEVPDPPRSERQAEIAEVAESQDFEVGQTIEATVTAIKGNKVTYEILGTIKLTEKEPKHAKKLTEGQTVTVEIVALKDDGSLRKVKYVT